MMMIVVTMMLMMMMMMVVVMMMMMMVMKVVSCGAGLRLVIPQQFYLVVLVSAMAGPSYVLNDLYYMCLSMLKLMLLFVLMLVYAVSHVLVYAEVCAELHAWL